MRTAHLPQNLSRLAVPEVHPVDLKPLQDILRFGRHPPLSRLERVSEYDVDWSGGLMTHFHVGIRWSRMKVPSAQVGDHGR